MEAKIVQNDEVCFFDSVEPFDERAICFGQSNLFTEPVEVEVKGTIAQKAGLMPDGTGEEGFPATGGAGNKDVLMPL